MAALIRNTGVPVCTTVADIKISVCVAASFWIPSTDTTDTGIAVVVACRVRNPDITKPAPTVINRLCCETNPRVLKSANIYPMNPNI